MEPWETLLRMLMIARTWPIPSERKVRELIALWAAIRESDEPVIRAVMRWPQDRELILDPLGEKIGSAYGDLLFGEDPDWTSAEPGSENDPGDQELLDATVEAWPAELPAAEETCVTEGEVWWRLSRAMGLDRPQLTWHSRGDVVPLLHGRQVLACAFVSRLSAGGDRGEVMRHIEIQAPGIVINRLFRGRDAALGSMVDLGRHERTRELVPEWRHGLDGMLAGRIVNRWGRRPLAGVSIYAGVWTQLLTLNEATTIGRENLRLTAKKRVVVPGSSLRVPMAGPAAELVDRGDGTMVPRPARPRFDAGEDVLVHYPLDADEGRESAPFKVLEYSFDAEALIAFKRDLVETICQRCDIVPQFIGSGDFGLSGNSGIALRVRLIPTVNATESRGRAWDTELPRVAQMAQLLEALPDALGGFGIDGWRNPGGRPSMERTTPLPEDPTEVAQRHSTLKTSDLISTETSLRERYPDADQDWLDSEVERIRADASSTMPSVQFPGVPPAPAPGG